MSLVRYATLFILFMLCCSMSHCFKEDVTPGAQTTVHGVVKDFRTGQVFPGVTIGITKQYQKFLADGPSYHDYESATTQADGSYSITFIPQGSGDYTLHIRTVAGQTPPFTGVQNLQITLGKDNKLDFSVYRTLNLTIHLVNRSTQNKKNFSLLTDTCCGFNNNIFYGALSFPAKVTDTMVRCEVPWLARVKAVSRFSNDVINSQADSISFRKIISLHKADTTVEIINP